MTSLPQKGDPATPRLEVASVVLDCSDAHQLADFYLRLLGWEVKRSEPEWVLIGARGSGIRLALQAEDWYEPPVWPEQEGRPTKMLHLDIEVDDLKAAREHALACGAALADHQPQEGVLVFLDPAGHPFCLFPR